MARKNPARVKAGKKLAKRLAKATKYCAGKTGRAFSTCRKKWFKDH